MQMQQMEMMQAKHQEQQQEVMKALQGAPPMVKEESEVNVAKYASINPNEKDDDICNYEAS